MSANLTAILYLVSGVLFIMSLRGLSSPETSRQGNYYGMAGMAVAVVTTLIQLDQSDMTIWLTIAAGIAIGGIIGSQIAKRIAMTDMPQLVAGFHSLVGLAAVLVAWSAFLAPDAFGIATPTGGIFAASLIEMSVGLSIGAITFSGSIIAFAKLQGVMSGAPIMLPGRHIINIGLALAIIIGISVLCLSDYPSSDIFLIVTILSFIIGFLLIIPIGGADMPVVVSMLNSYSGWAAAGIGFTLENTALVIT